MKRQPSGFALRVLSLIALAGCANAVWAQTPPANDNWANAIQINDPNAPVAITSLTPYSVKVGPVVATPTVTLAAATVEPTDPKITCKMVSFNGAEGQMANTVWYTYTTGAAVEYVNIKASEDSFNPTTFDPVIAVWTGTPTSGFRMVTGGCDDDGVPAANPANNFSRIAGLRLQPNTTYSIEVAFNPAPAVAPPAASVLRLDMAAATILTVDTTTDPVPVNFTGWTLIPGAGNPNPCLNPTAAFPNGTCSLRAAVETAAILGDQTPGGGAAGAAILVPSGTYPLSVYPTPAPATDPQKVLNVGGGDIDLWGSVGIYGAGMGQTTIVVPANDRAFSVQSASFTSAAVTPPGVAGGSFATSWNRFNRVNTILSDMTLQGPGRIIPAPTGPIGNSGLFGNGNGLDAFERVEFNGGYAIGNGGAISLGSPVQFRDCKFINNTATPFNANTVGSGGAINHSNSPDWAYIEVSGSTFTGNAALSGVTSPLSGGGAILAQGELVLTNSTLSGNSTNGYGGGVLVTRLNGGEPILDVRNSTIVENVADAESVSDGIGYGGGIYIDAASSLPPTTPPTLPIPTAHTITNSIIANNTVHSNAASAGSNCAATPYAVGTSQVLINATYNLTNAPGTGPCAFGGTGNIVGFDPMLNLLADNGGPTQTRALQPGSPAVDAGDPAGCKRHSGSPLTTDQRGIGFVRPAGARCDMGAFELDGVANAPGAPVLAAASDTGDSNSDGLTKVIKPTFTGTCGTDGDSVTLVVDSAAAMTTGTCSGSAYSITLTAALTEGTHAIRAFESNLSGPSPQSAPTSVTVDLTGPSIDLTSTPAAYEPTSTDAEFTFTVGESRLATAQCTMDGVTVADDNCSAGDATYFSLSPGQHTFAVTATDAAGNVTTKPYTWQIGTAGKPAVPVLASASDSGSSNADGITNADPLQFQDTCTSGDSMLLYDDTTVVGGPTLCASGVVSFSVSALAEGTHPITVTATRGGGTESAHSNVQLVVVDRTAPKLSIDSAPQMNMVSTSATFTFHADEASPLQCQLDGGAFTACTSPQTYNSLSLGAHSFTLAATDTAGNVATPQNYLWSVMQPLASGAPMLTPDSDSGRSSSDGVSNAAVATFMGACTDGDSMQLYDGNATAGTAAICAAGVYNVTLMALMEGNHSISVTSTRNGIESAKSPATAITIDRTAPSAPSITAVGNSVALTITVHGLAEPNALVTVHDGATSVCTAIADAAANFTCSGQLASGDSSNLTATAADLAGNVSGESAPYGVIPDQVFRNGFDD